MRKFDVIKQPILTEKTYSQSNLDSKYTFEVVKDANKREIAHAFQSIFNIKPVKVNIIVSKPQATRTGTKKPGFTPYTKKAIITLPKGTKLNIMGEASSEEPTSTETKTETKE
jgi:large subunit ribosomal protein L23